MDAANSMPKWHDGEADILMGPVEDIVHSSARFILQKFRGVK